MTIQQLEYLSRIVSERRDPIACIKDHDQGRPAKADAVVHARVNRIDQANPCNSQKQSRQQSTCPTPIEIPERDRVCMRPLLKQQRRNQKAAEDKENVNANEATFQTRAAVVSENGKDRHRSNPI